MGIGGGVAESIQPARIAVAGAGYVGLSVSILLARHNKVTLVDVVQSKVDLVNQGKSPIVDKEISEYLASGEIDLRATTDSAAAYRDADAVIVSTPTSYDEAANEFDTSYVEQVIDIVHEVNPGAWVVVKSTIPVGYTDELASRYPDCRFLFSPEFLREGHALYDNLHPSRIVVGVPDSAARDASFEIAAKWFAALLEQGALDVGVPKVIMRAREAEAVKLFANTYLATRVAFFNELDTYAEVNGLDSRRIIDAVTLDPRVGVHYCNPSFGYGGYCLPKDAKQLRANFEGIPQVMVSAVVDANDVRKRHIANSVSERFAGRDPSGITIGAYRLIMKYGSDNFRSSAIQGVIADLASRGFRVVVYEPALSDGEFNGMPVVRDLERFKRDCDLILVNRMGEALNDVIEKVYTRDCFGRD